MNPAAKEPNRTVNPDEVVALGAAILAGVMSGAVKNVALTTQPVVVPDSRN